MIDHSFYAPTLNIQGNARDVCSRLLNSLINFGISCFVFWFQQLHGFIVSHDGQNITEPLRNPKETIGIEGKPDIISVGTLLRAAGVDLDNMTIGLFSDKSLVFFDHH